MAKYENVETVIDRFLEYVRNNKQISLANVASALAISSSQAERIAILLEQSGFIEMHYGIRDVTVSVKATPKNAETKLEKPEETKSRSLEEMAEVEKEVMIAENLLKFFERDISRRVQFAESLLQEVEKRHDMRPEDLEEVEKEVELALSQLAAFSTEIKLLADKEEHFYKQLIAFRKKLDAMKGKKTTAAAVNEVGLIEKIIRWIKSLFTKVKVKVNAKPEKKRVAPRKHKQYDEHQGVTFLGHNVQLPAGEKQTQVQIVKSRVLKTRTDRVKQHYWKKKRGKKTNG